MTVSPPAPAISHVPPLLRSLVESRALSTVDAEVAAHLCAAGELVAETEEQVLQWLAGEYGLSYTSLENIEPDRAATARFPARVLLKEELLPLRESNGCIEVAVSRLFAEPGQSEGAHGSDHPASPGTQRGIAAGDQKTSRRGCRHPESSRTRRGISGTAG